MLLVRIGSLLFCLLSYVSTGYAFSTEMMIGKNSRLTYTIDKTLIQLEHKNKAAGNSSSIFYNFETESYYLKIRKRSRQGVRKWSAIEVDWSGGKVIEGYVASSEQQDETRIEYADVKSLLLQSERLLEPFLKAISEYEVALDEVEAGFNKTSIFFENRLRKNEYRLLSFYSNEYQEFLKRLKPIQIDSYIALQDLLNDSLTKFEHQFFELGQLGADSFFASLYRQQGQWDYIHQQVFEMSSSNLKSIPELYQFDFLAKQKS